MTNLTDECHEATDHLDYDDLRTASSHLLVSPDHSLAHDPKGGTVITLAAGVVLGSSVLVGLLVLVAKTRGWL